ncbi:MULTISPECIES: CdaR family transcriptional regulator [unclassified Leucobacter]|uniref:PucR family transcriptional regulator n=1 Tax=unclassified Leucobacter TaxID=2621730 RepID=UPI00165E2F52|nr:MULTISPECIES: helix-turn-helix domain-containing protein [unclassified Leucobacter]MBC9935735.1 helix-turn-helix domain-containing protein [Leucobacter sp. cx-87]
MSSSISSIIAVSDFSSGLRLSTLVEQLGSDTLTPVDRLPDSPFVQGVTFFDAETPELQFPGQLILLTSHSALTAEQLDLLCASAIASGASGVVARGVQLQHTSALVLACAHHGLPLLELTHTVGWRQFDALVSRLLGEHGAGLQLGPSSGDKLFALANSVAGVFRGSVAIEDHRRNILAYSAMPEQAIDDFRASGILYRKVPDKPINEIRYRQVFAAQGVARFAQDDAQAPRAAIAIRAGNISLGSIWAIDPDGYDLTRELSVEKQEILEQGAILAAGYLVDAWRFDHSDGRGREAAFRRLLMGTPQEGDQVALGLRPTQHVVLAALVCDGGVASAAELSEIRTHMARHLSVYFPGSGCLVLDQTVCALIPSKSTSEIERSFTRLLPELFRLIRRHCHVGLSEPQRLQASLAGRIDRARAIAECARDRSIAVATLPDVQAQLVLRECESAITVDGLLLPETAALLGDEESETRRTLLAWFEEQGNAPRVASRLNLHEQTVRYRIRQAVARLGIDLTDADRILTLWLQLRLAERTPAGG